MSSAASHCEPLVLLGASRRQQLADSLLQTLQGWRKQWSGSSHVTLTIDSAESLTRKAPLPGGRLLTFGADTSAGPLLTIAVPVDLHHELLGVAASRASVDGSGDIASLVVAEALQALCVRLASPSAAEGISAHSCHSDGLAQRWSCNGWSVTVKAAGDRVLMWARFSARLLLATLPAQPAKSAEPLSSRRSAIGEEVVDVHAWLGEAEVQLADLATLRVGDVILLDASVEGAGRLTLSGGQQIAGIRLGSVLGQRAVSAVR